MASLTIEKPTTGRSRRADTAGGTSGRKRIVRGFIGLLVLLAILEVITRAGIVNEAFLPPATKILGKVVELLIDPSFLHLVLQTLQAWLVGLLLATVVAVPVGLVLGSSEVANRASRIVIDLIRPIPSIALIPLAILVLGTGLEMKLALVVYASVWPILFNTIYGVHDVDPMMKDTARVYGFGSLSIVFRVTLVSAAPFIAIGIRLASSVALIIVITAEMLGGGGRGIGGYISAAGASGTQALDVFASTTVAGLLGLLSNLGLLAIERRVFRWQPDNREDQ